MPYLIDGHNLIDAMPDIHLDDPDDEVKLAERLKQYMMRKRKKCTVVFDNGLPGGVNPRWSNSQVEVLFAHSRAKADDLILERLDRERNPHNWQVVTDDGDVADGARARGASVIRSAEFAALLTKSRSRKSKGLTGEETHPVISKHEVEEMMRLFKAKKSGQGPK